MLHIMRRQAQSKFIQLLVFLIAVVFIFWGVGGNMLNSRNAAAKVNTEEISFQDYQRAYDQAAEVYREQFNGVVPDNFFTSINLKQQVLTQLVRGVLLRQGGADMGLAVSPEATRQEIATIPAFQEDGRFDLQRYRHVLAQNRMTPAAFEAGLHNDLQRSLTLAAIQRFAVVPEDELAQQMVLAGEEIRLASGTLRPEDFRDRVRLSEEALGRYYDEHRETYRPGPQVRLQYLLFARAEDAAAVQVTEEDIAARYAAEDARFNRPETRRARHILLQRDEDATARRLLAEQLLQQLRAGADFAALAQKHSQDSSAGAGGDLGFFGRGAMVPPFEEAVFALKVGETSDLIETQFGLHIIRLEAVQPARQQSLDEVRQLLTDELRQERAGQLAMARAGAAYEEVIRAGSMSAYAAQWQAPLRETDFFDREHPPEPFMRDLRFLDAAFRLQPGELSTLIEIDAGYALMFAVDQRRPEPPPLEQIADRVRQDAIRLEARSLARGTATELLLKARESGDLIAASSTLGLKTVKSPPVTHDPASQAASGLPAAVLREAFKLNARNTLPPDIVESADAFFVVQLLERGSRQQNLAPDQQQRLRDVLQAGRSEALTNAWLGTVEAQSRIQTNKQFVSP